MTFRAPFFLLLKIRSFFYVFLSGLLQTGLVKCGFVIINSHREVKMAQVLTNDFFSLF